MDVLEQDIHGEVAMNSDTPRFTIGAFATLLILCAMPVIGWCSAVGWLNPSAEAGGFGQPTKAFFDDNSNASCPADSAHTYSGYGISLDEAALILGIEVRLDAERLTQQDVEMTVELSWDGGMSWTSTGYSTGNLAQSMTTYVLGSPVNTWGHGWTAAELDDTSFRVRVSVATSDVGNVAKLDWIPVTIHYESMSLELSTTSIDFGIPGIAEFDLGVREISNAQEIQVSCGADWVMTVNAESSTWGYVGSEGDPLKPCSDLHWRSASSAPEVTYTQATYQGVSQAAATVAAGSAGQAISVNVDMRMLLSYDSDSPGTYTLWLVYTLTAP